MFTTIITDCWEPNEALRPITRFNALGLGPTSLLGINSELGLQATVEGGINLIDILDASNGLPGIVFLNVAPRGDKKDGNNGTHFCYFNYKKTLVIATLKGYCLSFIKHLEIADSVEVVELKTVLDFIVNKKLVDQKTANYIVSSQFRSFDFVPRLACWLVDGIKIPSSTLSLTSQFPLPTPSIWCIDAFGNAKSTLLSNKFNFQEGESIKTNLGIFLYYNRLKDIPFGKTAIYTGSSGIGDNRFLELATQGVAGSVSKKLKLKVGDSIVIK